MDRSERAGYERAVFAIQRIRNGDTAELSMAQLAFLNTNMADAYHRLPEEQFYRVYSLFRELLADQQTVRMNHRIYLDALVRTVKRFDGIAPYEKYCGRDEAGMKAFLDQVLRPGKNTSGGDDYLRYLKQYFPESSREELELFLAVLDMESGKNRQAVIETFETLPDRPDIFEAVRTRFTDAFFSGQTGSNFSLTGAELEALAEKHAQMKERFGPGPETGQGIKPAYGETVSETELSAEAILIKRIRDICRKDIYVYREAITEHIESVRRILSGALSDEEKADALMDILKSIYYDEVTDDVDTYFEEMDPRIYNRLHKALYDPTLCGVSGGRWGYTFTAGDLLAACFWAVTDRRCRDGARELMNGLQDRMMEDTLQEALRTTD